MNVAVIGGGVGGLAASLALRQVGVRTTVFERQHQFPRVAVGIVLTPNGVRALDALGVGDQVRERGHCLSREAAHQVSTLDDQSLGAIRYGEFYQRHGTPFVVIRRADLQQILLEAHGPSGLRMGAKLVEVRDGDHTATAYFADGSHMSADAVVGADGLRSAVRGQLFGAEPPRHVATTLRGITRRELPPGRTDGFTVVGPGLGMFFAPLGPAEMYWTATIISSEGWPRDPAESMERLLERLEHWPSFVSELVRAVDREYLVATDLADRPPLAVWSKGRITLLGDAAHAMTNFLGQGANTTLEDAVVLARCLDRVEPDDVADALTGYELERIGRTTRIVQSSAALASGEWSRDTAEIFSDYLEKVLNGEFMDWVYGFSPDTGHSWRRQETEARS